MNFEQLKAAWQTDIAMPVPASELDRLTDEIRICAQRYRHGALLRRIYGSAAFLLTLALVAALQWLPDVWPGMRAALAVWGTSVLVCGIGLWRIRRAHRPHPEAPLTADLQASLDAVRREIGYHHALRWTFWLPFGAGFLFATLWRVPHGHATPLPLLVLTAGLWLWGFIYGPRHWAARLESQAAQLERMLQDSRHDNDTTTGDDR